MDKAKEELIRELFEHERDSGYRQYRRRYIEDPVIVHACPDAAEREERLRGFWNHITEPIYPGFRHDLAEISVDRLLDLRADLFEQSNAVGLMEFQEGRQKAAEEAQTEQVNERQHKH